MTINLKAPEATTLRPRITVLGVGGAGCNAINNMIASKLEGVELVAANTDAQALTQCKAERCIQLGPHVTEGLGAGAQPEIGRAAAEESIEEVMEHLVGSHMVFITAGMGGGTGTGAAPVIARATREQGILTVGVVTKPFAFEGERRMRLAEKGIADLQQFVHTLIVIPNQNLFRVANDRTTFAQAFSMADEVLHAGVRGVTDLIVTPGLINPDFADVRAVISEMGKSMMGTGEAEGEERAVKAADMAISNPLLDDVSMKGARAVLINITGGPDLMLFEVEAAANRIRAEVDPDANIIFGNSIIDTLEGRIRVSVIATGIDANEMNLPGEMKLAGNLRLPPEMRMPKNVEPLRPHMKPRPVDMLKAAAATVAPKPAQPLHQAAPQPAAAANPVHRQVEALADGLGAETSVEAMILGSAEAPVVEPLAPVELPPAPASYRPLQQEPQRPAEPKRHGWGLFGRKPKEQAHIEPAPRPQPVSRPAPRAMAQAEPPQAAQQPSAPRGDDLFPDHKRDEQFEILAFLRRQTN
jgi:cell division protein FtsZ